MTQEPPMDDAASKAKDRIRVYRIIDRSCELAAQKGPHPLDVDCQCLACMTKRKNVEVRVINVKVFGYHSRR